MTIHTYLVPRLRVSGAIPPVHYVFMAPCLIRHRDFNIYLRLSFIAPSHLKRLTAFVQSQSTAHLSQPQKRRRKRRRSKILKGYEVSASSLSL
jgi:hypothetical protein